MNIKEFVGKTKEEAINKALEELGVEEENLLYKIEEVKGKLFKAATVKVKAVTINDVSEYLKSYLNELLTNMNIEANYEVNVREGRISIKMFSSQNSILIGKNGQTLKALTNILKQVVYKDMEVYPYIILDVEDYKEKQEKRLERLAKNIAREVRTTGVEVAMDNMNSYERRIVHNVLAKYEDLSTNSEGEEPNRHIVVKLK